MTHFRPIVPAMAFALLTSAMLTLPPRAAVPDRSPPAPPPRDWPMFGGSPSRNMVNRIDKNLPASWSVEDGAQKNIKWVAELGRNTFGSPVVANGIVFVSSDRKGGQAVLMALRATDGKLLWQNTHDHPKDFSGGSLQGIPSTAAVEGNRVYYLAPGCEAICAASDTGIIHWRCDLVKELKVFPGTGCRFPPLAGPLIVGDLMFVATSNGIAWGGNGELAAPNAPSFVALHKKTGKLAWQSNLPGQNIFVGGWSSPAYANVNNVPQVIFAGGDSVIYSFVPQTGELLWKCDCLPTREKKKQFSYDNFFVGTPVVVGDKLYIGLGAPEFTLVPKITYFLCLDLTKKGDVSLKSYDAKAEANKSSALVWAFGGPLMPIPKKKGRQVTFGPTVSTAAVQGGLLYIPETNGYLHCLDAATGHEVWQHDFKSSIWGSPYWVDGRVFVGTDDGDIVIFAHGRERKVLGTRDCDATIQTTPVVANGVLYVMTDSKLYAIARDK